MEEKTTIADKDSIIVQRDQTIAAKDALITEKDALILKLQAENSAKDLAISKLQTLAIRLAMEMNESEAVIAVLKEGYNELDKAFRKGLSEVNDKATEALAVQKARHKTEMKAYGLGFLTGYMKIIETEEDFRQLKKDLKEGKLCRKAGVSCEGHKH